RRLINRAPPPRRSEPLHYDFGDLIGDVPQHPSEVRQIVELSRAHFEQGLSYRPSIRHDRDGKRASVKARTESSYSAMLGIWLEDLRLACFNALDVRRKRHLVTVLFSLQ